MDKYNNLFLQNKQHSYNSVSTVLQMNLFFSLMTTVIIIINCNNTWEHLRGYRAAKTIHYNIYLQIFPSGSDLNQKRVYRTDWDFFILPDSLMKLVILSSNKNDKHIYLLSSIARDMRGRSGADSVTSNGRRVASKKVWVFPIRRCFMKTALFLAWGAFWHIVIGACLRPPTINCHISAVTKWTK